MATFAVLSGNLVVNVIVADDLESAEFAAGSPVVEYTTENPAGIDFTYDEESGVFVAPPEPPHDEPAP